MDRGMQETAAAQATSCLPQWVLGRPHGPHAPPESSTPSSGEFFFGRVGGRGVHACMGGGAPFVRSCSQSKDEKYSATGGTQMNLTLSFLCTLSLHPLNVIHHSEYCKAEDNCSLEMNLNHIGKSIRKHLWLRGLICFKHEKLLTTFDIQWAEGPASISGGVIWVSVGVSVEFECSAQLFCLTLFLLWTSIFLITKQVVMINMLTFSRQSTCLDDGAGALGAIESEQIDREGRSRNKHGSQGQFSI